MSERQQPKQDGKLPDDFFTIANLLLPENFELALADTERENPDIRKVVDKFVEEETRLQDGQ